MQRTFITGDKWLYYKLYSGQKTADMILTEIINPVCKQLMLGGLITKWFFIRYADPKSHIRWRLYLNGENNIGKVVEAIFHSCKPYLESGQLHKIQTDTYKRELERYGTNTIELAEDLFCYDSKMISEVLKLFVGDEGEQTRWLFGMKAIDQLLTDFKYTIQQKFELLTSLSENFGKEFNINSSLIKQLSNKYRQGKNDIFDFMSYKNDKGGIYEPLFELLKAKTINSLEVVSQIIGLHNSNNLQIPMDNLISSFIHMLMNRLFRSKQRLHEMVIYGFMFRYYRTLLAREKYNK